MDVSEKREFIIRYAVLFLVFIYPTSVLFIKHSFTPAMLLMMLYGCVILFKDIKAGSAYLHKNEILFFWAGASGIAISVISLIFGGDLLNIGTMELEFIDKQLRFLFFVPFLVLMKKTGMPEKNIWLGAVVASFASGFYALGIKITHPEIIRVAGGGNPINYGCFSVIAAFVSLNGMMYFRKIKKEYTIIPLSAFLMGMSGAILSGSRGAWVAIPVLSVITALNFRKYFRAFHLFVILVSGMLCVFIISMSVDSTIISDRINEVGSAVTKYFAGDEALDSSSDGGFISVGGRLEMYKTSLNIIKNNPVIGVGPGRYHKTVLGYINDGKADKAIEIYQYPHNDYLTVATCGGLLGLLAFIFMAYLFPIVIIYRYSGNKTGEPLFWAGMVIISGFMVFSLTNSAMFKNVRLHYYYLYLSAVAASLHHISYGIKKCD